MKSKTAIIIGAIIFIIAAASAATFLSGQSTDTTINSSNQQQSEPIVQNEIGITVKTDGKNVTVQATSVPADVQVPSKMITEMKNKAYNDIQSYSSTSSSLKSDMQTIAKKYNFTANVTLTSQFGTNQLPFLAIVSGTSMIPTLKDGQEVIALKTKNIKVGDIVISRHPTYGLIVKRVATIENSKVYLKSDNREISNYIKETTLSDGVVEISNITKTPLDTWRSISDIVGVVKFY
ncbi:MULTISPECIES: S24/S26 family peptidase [Methanobacterium]|uniref:S24/S26 family peptidase n=1 Tax=Methanobacterium veterum TaxID=408577 RepID=A0A9E4ZZW3_9EURY|nr:MULTISPECIES: S24/S26 family peptidase [Methanobacterium]MCZ3366294.1 S24/S26 family peptidase [Methanobacterium veterum]MCZ3371802.1 S24/S26 family peptidase [Methanobacterium veterum]